MRKPSGDRDQAVEFNLGLKNRICELGVAFGAWIWPRAAPGSGEAVSKIPKTSKTDGVLQSQIERMSIVGWGNL
jgi:hypothetical protein